MTDKMVPALLGGVVLGVLCTIFSVIPVPFLGLCCCLWAVGGGALAVMMYVKKSPTRVSPGEGAMVGAMAGVIGGAIYFVLFNLMFALIVDIATIETQFRSTGVDVPLSGFALIALSALLGAVFLAMLAVGGGALGVAIFEKRKDGDIPPAPPTFGGQPGGGGYAGGGGQPGGSDYAGGGGNVGAGG